jgi:hypothetical protein
VRYTIVNVYAGRRGLSSAMSSANFLSLQQSIGLAVISMSDKSSRKSDDELGTTLKIPVRLAIKIEILPSQFEKTPEQTRKICESASQQK